MAEAKQLSPQYSIVQLYTNACLWHHSRQEKPVDVEGHKLIHNQVCRNAKYMSMQECENAKLMSMQARKAWEHVKHPI